LKSELDDKINDLINNLQSLLNNDGGKNLAGMTALG